MQQHILVAEDYDHLFGSSLPSSTMKGKAKKNEITTDEARKLLRCLSAVPMRKTLHVSRYRELHLGASLVVLSRVSTATVLPLSLQSNIER